MPFIRVFRLEKIEGREYLDYLRSRKPDDPPLKKKIEKELIVNTDHISKIEVEYVAPSVIGDPSSDYIPVDVETGLDTAEARRRYRVSIGLEEVVLHSNPDDPVVKIIEDIYNKAIKGPL